MNLQKSIRMALALFLACAFIVGCGTEPGQNKKARAVIVSILPQKYFVERIAANRLHVYVMVPPGHNPETYEPTPQQMLELSNSEIYFRIGYIPFEQVTMEKIAGIAKKTKIVDTSKGVELLKNEHLHHNENPSESHKEIAGVDPHIWLSARAVKIQASHILSALKEADAENKDFYEKNYAIFVKEIEDLDKKITEKLKNLKNRKFMVYHPAWTYFAKDYGLTQLAVEMEGKDANPAHLKHLIDIARQENIKVIFVQSQFDTHNAESIANEIQGKIVNLNPLSPDWIKNMEETAIALQGAIE